jgi:hypothetical protein
MRFLTILSVLLFCADAAPADTKPPRVIINLDAPRSAIRAALMEQTPLGSSFEYVTGFISNRLQRTGSGAARITVEPTSIFSQPRAAKAMHVYLGQYYKHLGAVFLTAPMVVHENVSARWLFDRHGRLTDIVVDKQTRVY